MSYSLQYAPQRKWMIQTIDDWINPQPQDKRTGDEVAKEVINKIGITLKE